jgi:hypothetical protein
MRYPTSQLPRTWKKINYPVLQEHKFGRPSMQNLTKTQSVVMQSIKERPMISRPKTHELVRRKIKENNKMKDDQIK